MIYKIIVSPRAQNEIENALNYYLSRSNSAAKNFISTLAETYKILSLNPHFVMLYKNVRAINIKNYPFSIFFVIDEETLTVRILSCFHTSQDPSKRP